MGDRLEIIDATTAAIHVEPNANLEYDGWVCASHCRDPQQGESLMSCHRAREAQSIPTATGAYGAVANKVVCHYRRDRR
jgi:hypothetical protein